MDQKYVLMTVRSEGGNPTLGDAAAQLGLTAGDLNPEFGVVSIEPAQGLFAVEVSADRATQASTFSPDNAYQGPFSNPRIAPFGPIQEAPGPHGKDRSSERRGDD